MNVLKNLKIIGIYSGIVIIILFIISLFNLFGWLNSTASAVINMVFGAIILFFLGMSYGSKREKRGFIAGLYVGFISILIMFLISFLILRVKINVVMFVYYGILLLASVLGSMVGINKKKD